MTGPRNKSNIIKNSLKSVKYAKKTLKIPLCRKQNYIFCIIENTIFVITTPPTDTNAIANRDSVIDLFIIVFSPIKNLINSR